MSGKVLQNFSGLTMKSSYYWKPLKTLKLKKVTTGLTGKPNEISIVEYEN